MLGGGSGLAFGPGCHFFFTRSPFFSFFLYTFPFCKYTLQGGVVLCLCVL